MVASIIFTMIFGFLGTNLFADSTMFLPEGKEFLPFLLAYVDKPEPVTNMGKLINTQTVIKLGTIDEANKKYSFNFYMYGNQNNLLKTPERKTANVNVSVSGKCISLTASNCTYCLVDSSGKPLGEVKKSLTDYSNSILAEISKKFFISDEEYEKYAKMAKLHYGISKIDELQKICLTSANKLQTKAWIKENPIEGTEQELKILVGTIDESHKDGFAYYVTGIYMTRGGNYDKYTDSNILINFYTNDAEVINWETGKSAIIKGVVSKINFSSDYELQYKVTSIEITER